MVSVPTSLCPFTHEALCSLSPPVHQHHQEEDGGPGGGPAAGGVDDQQTSRPQSVRLVSAAWGLHMGPCSHHSPVYSPMYAAVGTLEFPHCGINKNCGFFSGSDEM